MCFKPSTKLSAAAAVYARQHFPLCPTVVVSNHRRWWSGRRRAAWRWGVPVHGLSLRSPWPVISERTSRANDAMNDDTVTKHARQSQAILRRHCLHVASFVRLPLGCSNCGERKHIATPRTLWSSVLYISAYGAGLKTGPSLNVLNDLERRIIYQNVQ